MTGLTPSEGGIAEVIGQDPGHRLGQRLMHQANTQTYVLATANLLVRLPTGGLHSYRESMAYTTDPRVDVYIDALPDWQQAICRQVRDMVHAADPEVTETIKRTNRPYFVLQGNIAALLAAKDHVNVFLYDGAIVPDPERIITAGRDNTTARTVAVRQGETINAHALTTMFKHIIANNRAGGWRKLKREADHGS
jgi:hypothetical protein